MEQNEYGNGGNCVFALSEPIMHGQTEITELALRPIKGKDLLGIKTEIDTANGRMIVNAEETFKIVYKLTGIPAPVLAQMAAKDAVMLSLEVQTFLFSGRWTGLTLPQS